MSNKRELIKTGVGLVVVTGVSAIVGGACGLVRPRDVGKIKNFCIGVGALVLASMAGDQAAKYTDTKIDETADLVNKILSHDDEEEEEEEI